MVEPQVKIRGNLAGKLPGTLSGGKLPGGQLPGVPQKALDPQQQLEALRRVQAQAEQRVKLGVQLFKAAEARTAQQRSEIEQLRAEQDELREQLQQDIARSFQSYDQWIAKVDDTLTNALKSIEGRIEQLQSRWKETEQRIETMIDRSQVLLSESVEIMRAREAAMESDEPLSCAPRPDAAANDADDNDPVYTEALRKLQTNREHDTDAA